MLSARVCGKRWLWNGNVHGYPGLGGQSSKENHRTETEFEDSLIAKIFMFQFCNSFSSFFYIAFAKKYVDGCMPEESGGCMLDLSMNLLITIQFTLSPEVLVEAPWHAKAVAARAAADR